MVVKPQQTFDGDVLQFKRETDRKFVLRAPLREGYISDSLIEPDADIKDEIRQLGMIWLGRFLPDTEALISPFAPDLSRRS